MFFLPFLLLVGLAYSSGVERFYSNSKFVQEITSIEEFKTYYNSQHNIVIEFYAHWCGHCKQFSSDYAKAAEHMHNQVIFAAVNCDHNDPSNKEASQVCGHFKVESLPTVVMITPRDIEEKKQPTGEKIAVKVPKVYNGKRTAAAVAKWANANVEKDLIKQISSKKELTDILQIGEITKFLVFGEKPTFSNKLIFIAQSIRPDLPVSKVGVIAYSNDKSLATELGITEFPSIVRFSNKDSVHDKLFSGEMTFDNMKNWITENAGDAESFQQQQQQQHQAKSKPTPKKPKVAQLHQVESVQDWENACPTKGLCFLAFLNPSDESHPQFLEILNEFYPKHPELHTIVVNREKFPNFSSAFNIGEMNPQVALFQRGTLRVKNFFGGFELSQLEEFIKNAFSGKRIVTLDSVPVLDEQQQTEKADL